MNDHDLTQRFHEALDDAAPDPLLWNRVETAVNRKTRTRRLGLIALAAAVPATIAIAAVAMTGNLPSTTPDVISVEEAPEPAPTGPTTATGDPDATSTEGASAAGDGFDAVLVRPMNLTVAVLDGSLDVLERIDIPGVDRIDAVAGFYPPSGGPVVAAVAGSTDRDGVREHHLWLLDVESGETRRGPMISRSLGESSRTFSAAFDHRTGEVIVLMSEEQGGDLSLATVDILADTPTVTGQTFPIPGPARIDDVDSPLPLVVTATSGAYSIATGLEGPQDPWVDGPVASLSHDTRTSTTHLLVRTTGTEWTLRTVDPTGDRYDGRGRTDASTPDEVEGAHPRDLQLLRSPDGTLMLRAQEVLWQYEADGSWTRLGRLDGVLSGFEVSDERDRPEPEVDRTSWTDRAISESSTLSPRGVGAVRVGMTADEVEELTGQRWLLGDGFDGTCYYARLEGVPHLDFQLEGADPSSPFGDARVASVSTRDQGAATEAGIAPGAPRADVEAAYGQLDESPAAYTDNGVNLDVTGTGTGNDAGTGIRFVLDASGTVETIRVGTDARLALEGCA